MGIDIYLCQIGPHSLFHITIYEINARNFQVGFRLSQLALQVFLHFSLLNGKIKKRRTFNKDNGTDTNGVVFFVCFFFVILAAVDAACGVARLSSVL